MLQAGQNVNEELVLNRPLGAGSMGQVWVAYHRALRTEVAVKFILEGALQYVPNAGARFMREALNASRIQSPHAVRTLDYAISNTGTPFIVMELLRGESLEDRLERGGPLSVRETWTVLSHVGAALDAARQLGIVHRDIKPQNLFICPKETGNWLVKVLDFGNAKSIVEPVLSHLSTPGMLAGSPAYVSRDLLLDPDELDHRADLWALAVTAFKCLTGELPFRGRTLIETVQSIIDGESPKASLRRPELGSAADRWFARVFDHDSSKRPRSGAEMAQSFAEEMGLLRCLVSTAPPPRRPRALRYAIAAAAAVVLAGVGLAACSYVPHVGAHADAQQR